MNWNAKQKINGTQEIRYEAQITNAPETYDALVALAADDNILKANIYAAVVSSCQASVLGRLGQLDRAGQESFTTIGFVEAMTTVLTKITAASMCAKLEEKNKAIADAMQTAIMAGDIEAAQLKAAEKKEVDAEIVIWAAKRETERVQKATARAASDALKKAAEKKTAK